MASGVNNFNDFPMRINLPKLRTYHTRSYCYEYLLFN